MPKIKFSHVVSFSSEDSMHVAQNLLSSDTAKKWKCGTPGEKSATIVLQLEKATVISGIDVGNEHSAYIEVLVSRSSTGDDFKVLLLMSSFMTPAESRQSTNVNKVRMFTAEHLSKPISNEKWDRVKIVCTQPFNKHVQYGLSFITLHSPEYKDEAATSLGRFVLREPSPDSFSAGSLFAKRKQLEDNDEPLSAATAIRKASDMANDSPISKPKLKHSLKPKNGESPTTDLSNSTIRNRNELLYNEDEEKANEKIDRLIENKNKEIRKKQEEMENIKEKQSKKQSAKKDDSVKVNLINKKKEEKNTSVKNEPSVSNVSKRKLTEAVKDAMSKKKKSQTKRKPFDRLLEGVVLVISGIQNPDRANLRTMALSMGAKYKADWDNSCTHLICAFPNTPKFNQVKGKGKIITRKWIEECSNRRKRLPWRRFALDKSDKGKAESEEEICEQTDEDLSDEQSSETTENFLDIPTKKPEKHLAPDIKEQVSKIETQQTEKNNNSDPFLEDTDEEDKTTKVNESLSDKLPSFFANKLFYIDKVSFEDKDCNLLRRYIISYKGFDVDSLCGDVDYIITKDKDRQNFFDNAGGDALVVLPNWIWACHNAQKLVPIEDYLLT